MQHQMLNEQKSHFSVSPNIQQLIDFDFHLRPPPLLPKVLINLPAIKLIFWLNEFPFFYSIAL